MLKELETEFDTGKWQARGQTVDGVVLVDAVFGTIWSIQNMRESNFKFVGCDGLSILLHDIATERVPPISLRIYSLD